MKKLKEFDIPFVGLKQGKHRFEYQIDKTFFEAFDYEEFNEACINVAVILDKKINLLELTFEAKGTVNVFCDTSNEPYDQSVKGTLEIVVKFGEAYNDENEEILIIPHGEHKINIAQYIYEMIVLAIPVKKIHPGIKDGSISSDILKKLEELQPKETKKDKEETDPRWDTLKKLL
ncbi:DUF177 domain-containing protein [Leptobacterium sp. I13]|uniref:YceD family protein n=1 Tax=Leptobacterium meishanense TaxID=3128904 RepID=UPI0030EEF5F9